MRIRFMTNFKFFYSLVGLTFVCLVVFTTIIKPVVRHESGYGNNILPELRIPLAVDQDESLNSKAVSRENANNDNINDEKSKNLAKYMNMPSVPEDTKIESNIPAPSIKEDLSKPKPENPKKVEITFDNPDKYKGPIVEGWPPNHDRYMPNYIHPDENSFSIQPSKTHFKYCNLMVIIHSTIDAFNDRMGVRDTWMQYITQHRVNNVSVVFLVAKEKYGENITQLTRERIQAEHAKYDDILQVDMVDHYNNLTLKSVFTLKFFLNESNFYDPPPFHIMKIDNDVYLNVPQLVKLLKDPKLKKTDMYLIGHRFGTRKKPPTPIRVPKNKKKQQFTNKWWVPKYLYNGSKYPVILSGSGYVTTRPAARCLFNESLNLPFFHLEDVFLTGFAAENCGIPRYHSDGFHAVPFNFKDVSTGDVMWHYLKTKSVIHMHSLLMYDDLMTKYQHVKDELNILKEQQINGCNDTTSSEEDITVPDP